MGTPCVEEKKKNLLLFSSCLLYKQEVPFLLGDIPNDNMGEKYKRVRVKRIKNEGR